MYTVMSPKIQTEMWTVYVCISTVSLPRRDYVQVRVSAVLVEETL